MRKLSDEQWESLASVLEEEVARLAPGWTDHNAHDPGITVLEVLTYALTDLHYRVPLSASHRALVLRVAELADSLAEWSATANCPPGLQRVNFFPGQLLTAEDLRAEQNYLRDKARRLNRLLIGAGVVTGLGIKLERTGNGARVLIEPGLAISPRGEEIEVCAPTPLPLPAKGTSLLVLLHYAERPCRPVVPPVIDPLAQPVFSRIAETFGATLAPTADDTAVALARVKFSRGRWLLDRKFKAAKARV